MRAHHAPEDIALMKSIPGMTVHVPSWSMELDAMLQKASGPTYIRLCETEHILLINPGRWHTGKKATVVAVGPAIGPVDEAACRLGDGLDVAVIYLTSVRPFLAAPLLAAQPSHKILLVEPYFTAAASCPRSSSAMGARRPIIRCGRHPARLPRGVRHTGGARFNCCLRAPEIRHGLEIPHQLGIGGAAVDA
jgi:hypothetical protein